MITYIDTKVLPSQASVTAIMLLDLDRTLRRARTDGTAVGWTLRAAEIVIAIVTDVFSALCSIEMINLCGLAMFFCHMAWRWKLTWTQTFS
jgi:hypothetical protein